MILKSFNEFSAILSPELSVLNLKAEEEPRVLMGLFIFAAEKMKNEENRLKCLEELKQLRLRLAKYKRLAKVIKNIQDSLEKALTICSQLPPSKWTGPAFEALLDEAKEVVEEARQNLENSRLFFVGFGTPVVKRLPKKKMSMEVRSEGLNSTVELMKRWKKDRGSATYFPASSLEEWFEEMGGTGLHERSDAYPLGHLRGTAADHLLIVQADSFLSKNTRATFPLRLRIIVRLFLAAFGETVERGKVKSVLVQPKNKSVKTRT